MLKQTGFIPAPKGSVIGIASISGAVDEEKIFQGAKLLEGMDYRVKFSPNLFERMRYLSGTDEERVEGFYELLMDDEVSGIILARGGFGAIRILNLFDFEVLRNNSKFIMGYSDASSFLNYCFYRLGIKTVHGPTLSDIERCSTKLLSSFFSGDMDRVLFSKIDIISCSGSEVHAESLIAKGQLMGGNLATLASLSGTEFIPDFKDSILFLEEVNESPYKIDRMLCQMKLSGKIDSVNGLILGEFLNCGDDQLIIEIFREYFQDIPIVKSSDFGHGEMNIPIIIGADAVIERDKVCYA